MRGRWTCSFLGVFARGWLGEVVGVVMVGWLVNTTMTMTIYYDYLPLTKSSVYSFC